MSVIFHWMSHQNPLLFQMVSCCVMFSEVPKTVNSIIVKYRYNLKQFSMLNILKCNLFLWWLNFQHPLLQASVSHEHSENILIYWFYVQETFLIIINVENNVYLCGNCDTFFLGLFFFFLMNRNNSIHFK